MEATVLCAPVKGLTAHRMLNGQKGAKTGPAGTLLGWAWRCLSAELPRAASAPAPRSGMSRIAGAFDAGEILERSGRLSLADPQAGCILGCRHGHGGL